MGNLFAVRDQGTHAQNVSVKVAFKTQDVGAWGAFG